MININTIQRLLQPWDDESSSRNFASQFAEELGWFPSDIIKNKENGLATGHLIVEYGLENPVAISFINNKYSLANLLEYPNQIDLLNISYNNLIDYHIAINSNNITAFHNRLSINNNILETRPLNNYREFLYCDEFNKIIENQSTRDLLPALDDELISTISRLKKLIFSELNGAITNEEISNFFNAIIFTRAIEDRKHSSSQILLKNLYNTDNGFTDLLNKSLADLEIKKFPDQVINKDLFKNIDKLSKYSLNNLINDFYTSKHIPYRYNFSIMSKHALSKIYERYVSVLNIEETNNNTQYSLFSIGDVPREEVNKSSGSYYTPQFIARFFNRYIRKTYLNKLDGLKILEPSVGSGIFLRTLLEECTENDIERMLKNITGIDKNETACNATKLSLTLLYLAKKNNIPNQNFNILNIDSLDYFQKNKKELYNIIISNPPFIKYNLISENDKSKVINTLGKYAFNKYDLYLAFIKIAIDHLKKEGLGLFVLPNTFLTTDSAKKIREYLSKECDILCLIDLSSVDYKIFEDADIYPILLIFQKRHLKNKLATIALIRDYVGRALTDILKDVRTENISYSISDVPQSFFSSEKWHFLAPSELNLMTKLSQYKKIKDFVEVRTGFASGNIEAFIVNKQTIPIKEKDIYVPYLSDREMNKYTMPKEVKQYLFYPYYTNGDVISEEILKNKYQITYQRISKFYDKLSERAEVKKGRLNWWEPNRARKRDFMLIPKIVTPHLVFYPKFSYDISGQYAISRAPFFSLKEDSEYDVIKEDFMIYILGMLNSPISTWYLLNHCKKYQNGFIMLEPSELKEIPIIDPKDISRKDFLSFIQLIKNRLAIKSSNNFFTASELDTKINKLSLNFYDLNKTETNIITGEDDYYN